MICGRFIKIYSYVRAIRILLGRIYCMLVSYLTMRNPHGSPTQILDWLGLQWNSLKGTLSIVQKHVCKILDTIQSITNSRFVISARKLVSFMGQILSTAAVIGNIARIMTRHCSMSIASAAMWDRGFALDEFCRHEISF
jgi:hypothetical protein